MGGRGEGDFRAQGLGFMAFGPRNGAEALRNRLWGFKV